ncbi:MAG: glycosyltransferase family 2 protein [Halocynthiibacter sp.]
MELPLDNLFSLFARNDQNQPQHIKACLLGEALVTRGLITADQLADALTKQALYDCQLGEILMADALLSEEDLYKEIASQHLLRYIDLNHAPAMLTPKSADLAQHLLAHDAILWRKVDGTTLIATASPDKAPHLFSGLPDDFGPAALTITTQSAIHEAYLRHPMPAMVARAETRVPEDLSCRTWNAPRLKKIMLSLLIGAFVCLITFPEIFITALTLWLVVTLVATVFLKIAGVTASFFGQNYDASDTGWHADKLPKISILIPLYKESRIAHRLISRLHRLKYPRALLEVLIVAEEDDTITQDALSQIALPHWIRTVTVPDSRLKTKPRALNYALDFCKGSIIGIYDAEDAPEADQLLKVAQTFETAGDDVACVQGRLDYFNTKVNWLSRCFTIEYAAWYRIMLPGLQILKMPIPLGGTTLFIKRDAIEHLGRWDAQNVTEDADLGIRIARFGYRTAMVDSTTFEEANCRIIPWIKQRSRWIKGYLITYGVHMRDPRKLLRELGLLKFTGFQILFLGSLTQTFLMPIFWMFWLFMIGLHNPLSSFASDSALWTLYWFFLGCEMLHICINGFAAAKTDRTYLIKWVPTLMLYYPFAVIAAYKGLWELLSKPFYWDKTEHGLYDHIEDY